MKAMIDILLLAIVVIYIVDVSGFTDAWRDALAKFLKVSALKPLRPFDCGKCMTWWTCLIYAICTGNFTIPVIAFIALLSLLSVPIGNLLYLLQDVFVALVNRIEEKL